MISEYCRKCSGEGRIRVKKDIKVKIPPGVNKGSILRVAGEGDAGPRGYVFKLYSCISVTIVCIIVLGYGSVEHLWDSCMFSKT